MDIRKLSAVALTAAMATSADAAIVTFDELAQSLVHGEIVDTDYLADHGLTIAAVNDNETFDLAVIFDTKNGPAGGDGDLIGPPWVGGNVGTNTELNNALIIQNERDAGDVDDIVDNPNDEAEGALKQLIFTWEDPIDSFGFTSIDVEQSESAGYFIKFFNDGSEIASVPFSEYTDNTSLFFDSSVAYAGDNTANVLDPITAAELSTFTSTTIDEFDKVVIEFGGSGAVDTLAFTFIPVPTSVWMGLTVLGGLAVRSRFKA